MNREIKFRAWDSINNEMIYEKRGVNLGYGGIASYEILKRYSIVMQFTGLLDKNGKEIYEGDVATFKTSEQGKEGQFYTETHQVVFHNGSFEANRPLSEWSVTGEYGSYRLKERHYASPAPIASHRDNFYYKNWDFEIIGNIYENPELLNS